MPRRIRPTKLELDNATDALRRAGESIEGYQEVVRRLTDARAQVLQILGEPNGKSSREAARRVVNERDRANDQFDDFCVQLSRDLARAGKDYTEVPVDVAVHALVDVVLFYRELITKMATHTKLDVKVVDK